MPDHWTNKTRTLAKGLRKNPTNAEKVLWKHLRAKQMDTLKFRRQVPIGRYIVDFVCYERNLIVEVDGGQHSQRQSDALRDEWLEEQGFRVLRLWNSDVLKNIDGVLEVIRKATLP